MTTPARFARIRPARTLEIVCEVNDSITLIERVAYTPFGQQRRRWDEQRVNISLDELRKIADKFLNKSAASESTPCTRPAGHNGPCNGLPRVTCPIDQDVL